jgi:hypothetical protein
MHNGYFFGYRGELTYDLFSVDHFDNCSADTWSIASVNEIITTLGCERDGKLHVYWCLPRKELRYGLVMIENQADVREMIIASRNEKTLDLYIDHTNFLLHHRPEVVVRNLVTNEDENMPPPPPM